MSSCKFGCMKSNKITLGFHISPNRTLQVATSTRFVLWLPARTGCAVIDRITREAIERENPHMKSKYRILKDVIIGDMPAQPICIRKQIDKVTRNKILDAFLRTDCSTSKEMKKLSFVKYEAVNHDFYVNLANRISNSEYVVLSNSKRRRQCSSGNKTDGNLHHVVILVNGRRKHRLGKH